MPRADGVLFCGGGTGGHVLPGLAVAAELRRLGVPSLRWIGDPQRIEAKLVPAAGIELMPFGLDRPRPWNPLWLLRACRQTWRSWQELRRRPPTAIVALGGYAALLPGLLAPLLRRPLVVMEQNAYAGRTNRLLARFARLTVTQFPQAALRLPVGKVRQWGNPVRPIRNLPRGGASTFTVLVVGGSLAAKSLNDLVALAAERLARIPGLHLIHCAGEQDCSRVEGIYRSYGLSAEVHGYVADMPSLYDRIDLAVTRAGATTVAELCAAGIGAIYIPLPWAADDHQTANAGAVAALGGAITHQQRELTPQLLADDLEALAADRGRVAAMGVAARLLARPEAALRVARTVLRLGRRDAGRKAAARSRFRAMLMGSVQ